LAIADGGRLLIDVVRQATRADVVAVVPGGGERALVDEVKRLAIETPGKIAVYPDAGAAAERQILAGADALLLADKDNHLARTAGLAMRYGTLPLVPDCAAYHDYIVDYDVASRTGTGLLYNPDDPGERVSVVSRSANLRSNPDVWRPVQEGLMRAAPQWARTAAQYEAICLSQRTTA
jgi:glycogen synthase